MSFFEENRQTERRQGDRRRSDRRRLVLPNESVCVDGRTTLVGVPTATANATPEVRVVKDGSIVQAIEVICPCGNCLRLVCQYD